MRPCRCGVASVDRYRARISGPLLDRIDIHLNVPAVPYADISNGSAAEPARRSVLCRGRRRGSAAFRRTGPSLDCPHFFAGVAEHAADAEVATYSARWTAGTSARGATGVNCPTIRTGGRTPGSGARAGAIHIGAGSEVALRRDHPRRPPRRDPGVGDYSYVRKCREIRLAVRSRVGRGYRPAVPDSPTRSARALPYQSPRWAGQLPEPSSRSCYRYPGPIRTPE